ncbi:MAG: hypothetical protein QXS16_05230 [Pyrobaculum sp.]
MKKLPYKLLDATISAMKPRIEKNIGAAAICSDGSLRFYKSIYTFKDDEELRKKCDIILSMIARFLEVGRVISYCISYSSEVFCGDRIAKEFVDAGGLYVVKMLKNVAKWINVYQTRIEYELYAGDIKHDIKLDKVGGVVYNISAHRDFKSMAAAEHYARVTSKLISPYLKRLERRGIVASIKDIHAYQEGAHVYISGDVEYKYAGGFNIYIYVPSKEMIELFSALAP